MFNTNQKVLQKTKVLRRAQSTYSVVNQVKQILGKADQQLILMVRG